MAKLAGVSRNTVNRIERILKEATPEDIEALRKGNLSVNKVFEELDNPKKDTSDQDKKPKGTKKPEQGKGKKSGKYFGKKFNGVLKTLKTFEQSLSQKRDQSKLQNLIKTIESLIKEVEEKV